MNTFLSNMESCKVELGESEGGSGNNIKRANT